MTIAIRAAIAILSIASFGTAYADSVGGTLPITFFNQLPSAEKPPMMQNVPAAATAQDGAHAYVTQSRHGTWLYGSSHGGDGTQG
jgi:hypothetical protein